MKPTDETPCKLINARGTFTPLGVSRSSHTVAQAVTDALIDFADIGQLQADASKALATHTGAEAGAIVHCAAAGITMAVAATMTGTSAQHIAQLPDTTGLVKGVALPMIHTVNYGQPIEQAVRLAGAVPIMVGDGIHCSLEDLDRVLSERACCCLLLVSSRLTRGAPIDFKGAVDLAHRYGIPTIIDGAAQDFRMRELLATGADLLIVSAQKYLAAPTAGLVVGHAALVEAVRAQEKGIGRGMKATKESIAGVLAALRERASLDEVEWQRAQEAKVSAFIARANSIPGIEGRQESDPTALPLVRAHLAISGPIGAQQLVERLRSGSPAIWVMDHRAADEEIVLELVHVHQAEIDIVLDRLRQCLA